MPPVPAEPKKLQRLLWISDSPKFLGVGQSRVTREVCDRWHGKDFDVSVLGFGHNQPDTPTDRDSFPYGIYPVERDDPAGMIRAIDAANPEIVVMSHDLFRFPNVSEAHAKHKNTTFVGYITVDSEQIVSEWRYLLESYTGLVVPSPFGKKEIHRQWFDLPVEVVPYGVNQTLYHPPKDGKAALKHVSYENSKKAVLEGMSSVNMVLDPRDKFCACFFGHNQLRKNVAALVEAWGDFATGKEDTFLYFSCHSTRHNMHVGYYPPHLLSRAENMVYIPNPGSDMDMGMVMAFSDVLLHPVLGEGFGLCVHPDTVLSCGRGPEPIKDVHVGDHVLSHDGKFHAVQAKTIRDVDQLWKVRCHGGYEVLVTKEHPFLASAKTRKKHGEHNLTWMNVTELKTGFYVATPRPRLDAPLPEMIDLAETSPGFSCDATHIWHLMGFSPRTRDPKFSIHTICKMAGVNKRVVEESLRIFQGMPTARPGFGTRKRQEEEVHRVLGYLNAVGWKPPTPQKYQRHVTVDAEFLEFLGWYIAEGSGSSGSVELSLGWQDHRHLPALASTAQRLGGCVSVQHKKDKHVTRLLICNTALASTLRSLCGHGAVNKRIPEALWKSGEKIIPLIRGLLLGDGCFKFGRIQFTTVSKTLAWQLRLWLASMGFLASYKHQAIRGYYKHEPYVLTLGGQQAKDLCALLEVPMGEYITKSERTGSSVVRAGDYLLTPIRSITAVPYNGPVYDIQVEGSHCFEGNGLLLHNTIGEAMASGTVPITTNFSSMADLCDDTNAYMLPCTRVIMEGGLTICAPEVDGIVVALEQAYADWKSGRLVEKAKAGIERIKPYTWNRCAESLKAVVEKYQRMRISKMSTIHAMRIA